LKPFFLILTAPYAWQASPFRGIFVSLERDESIKFFTFAAGPNRLHA
jgi:hypothetical protein